MTKTITKQPNHSAAPAPQGADEQADRRPSHYVYAVRKGGTGKGFWTRIGAAWANKDGEGFSIKLDLVPINGSDIVIRTPRDDREEGGAA